jgi:hypothetical protein
MTDFPRTWWFRYVLYRYGHRVAYLILGFASALALTWTGLLYTRVQDQTRLIQSSRAATTGGFCRAINASSRATNAEVGYLKLLILGGVRASRPFEKVYRQFGLPPYATRVRLAEKQAHGLDTFRIVPIDCGRLQKQLEREANGR